jgi:aryl-alcohol dehydrogenase-like predicted oxidoreductase
LPAVVRLGSLASEARLSLSQLALAWILRHDNVSSTIIGASRPEQIEDNAEASGTRLSPEVAFEIDSILKNVEIRYSLVEILGTKLGRPHPFTHSQTWT